MAVRFAWTAVASVALLAGCVLGRADHRGYERTHVSPAGGETRLGRGGGPAGYGGDQRGAQSVHVGCISGEALRGEQAEAEQGLGGRERPSEHATFQHRPGCEASRR